MIKIYGCTFMYIYVYILCYTFRNISFIYSPSPSAPTYLEPFPGTEKRDPEPQVEKEVNQGEHSRQSSSSSSDPFVVR